MRDMLVQGIGICAAGLPDWQSASPALRDATPFEPGMAIDRAVDSLPATERRRINETSRLACLAAADALAALPSGAAATAAAVFTSAEGDGAVLAQLLKALAQRDIALSPTAFHNSVYNAPAGYWTIASQSCAPTTTMCADRESFAMALLEAYAQALAGMAPVLVIAVDAPFPEVIRTLGASAAPFACALVLDVGEGSKAGRSIGGWRMCDRARAQNRDDLIATAYGGNAAAAALPLLRALAAPEAARVQLPYLDGLALELEVGPE